MYKVIEKNEYGILVIDDEILNGISDVCRKCKYLSNCEDEWMKCIINTYYLPDSEAEKLERENQLMNTTIDDLYIESKCYYEVKKKLDDTQKELIDLQNENKQLKGTIENMKAIAINIQQPDQCHTVTSVDYVDMNRRSINSLISMFSNGDERFHKSALFNSIIHQLYNGEEMIKIIDVLCDKLDETIKIYAEYINSDTRPIFMPKNYCPNFGCKIKK